MAKNENIVTLGVIFGLALFLILIMPQQNQIEGDSLGIRLFNNGERVFLKTLSVVDGNVVTDVSFEVSITNTDPVPLTISLRSANANGVDSQLFYDSFVGVINGSVLQPGEQANFISINIPTSSFEGPIPTNFTIRVRGDIQGGTIITFRDASAIIQISEDQQIIFRSENTDIRYGDFATDWFAIETGGVNLQAYGDPFIQQTGASTCASLLDGSSSPTYFESHILIPNLPGDVMGLEGGSKANLWKPFDQSETVLYICDDNGANYVVVEIEPGVGLSSLAIIDKFQVVGFTAHEVLESSISCGNGFKEIGEFCDVGELNSATCTSEGFTGGILQCNPSCNAYDTSLCTSAPSTIIEDFEGSTDWIATGTTQGQFEIGVPTTFNELSGNCLTFGCTGSGVSEDHTSSGTMAACTNLDGYGAPNDNVLTNSLTSPVFDFTGKSSVQLELWRFLEVEGFSFDICVYEYKNSVGGSWNNLETYTGIEDNDWTQYTNDISSIAGLNSHFQLRFYCTLDDTGESAGLCIDDVKLTIS